eukprot:gene15721-biopygen6689
MGSDVSVMGGESYLIGSNPNKEHGGSSIEVGVVLGVELDGDLGDDWPEWGGVIIGRVFPISSPKWVGSWQSIMHRVQARGVHFRSTPSGMHQTSRPPVRQAALGPAPYRRAPPHACFVVARWGAQKKKCHGVRASTHSRARARTHARTARTGKGCQVEHLANPPPARATIAYPPRFCSVRPLPPLPPAPQPARRPIRGRAGLRVARR